MRIKNYNELNSLELDTLREVGSIGTGKLFIKRPGRVRFEYAKPDRSLVMASAGNVAIFDNKSNQPPEQYPLIAARWGLDLPLWERFLRWFGQMLQGDFGYSMLYNAPVSQVIGERFATSFALLFSAWLFSGIVGLAMGISVMGGAFFGARSAISGGAKFIRPVFITVVLGLTVRLAWQHWFGQA